MADEGFKRKLTAILSADVEGYSRLMGDDEEATVRILTSYREVLTTLIQQHNGKVLDSPGDNLLAEFASVVDAVQGAVAVQKEIKARNDDLPEDRRMKFRIGINLGDVIQEDERIYGDGVNIAARLEGLSAPGGICISKTAFDQIESKLPYGYEYLGSQPVKNIARPVGAYRVLMEPRVTVAGKLDKEKRSPVKQMPFLLGVAAIAMLAVAVGIWQFYVRRPTVEPASIEKMAYPLPDKPSIAVLPFDNLSKDPDQEYIADAISENIIATLSSIPHFLVIARNSTFVYKDRPVKISEISEELGVEYVLEGSVMTFENELRVTAQLIDALKGHHLWAKKYDVEIKDIFDILDGITLAIAHELTVKLTVVEDSEFEENIKRIEERLKSEKKPNLEAWILSIKAYYLGIKGTKEDMAKGKKLLLRAIDLDPEDSRFWNLLAIAHYSEGRYGWSQSRKQSFEKALIAINKAIELNDSISENYATLCHFSTLRGEFDKAISACEKAVQFGPSSAYAHAELARLYNKLGTPEKAIPEMKMAMRLNPHYPGWWIYGVGRSYYLLKRYSEAEATFLELLDQIRKGKNWTPKYAHLMLSAVYIESGREQKARAEMQKVLEIDPKFNIEDRRKQVAYKDPALAEREMDAHRRAGAPEKRISK